MTVPDTAIQEAVRIIRAGGVVGFATETYYGLGVDPFNRQALARLFSIKGRPRLKPILVLVSGRSQLGWLAASVPPPYQAVMDRFWPGPVTLVFPARAEVPSLLTGGTATVGVRQSPHPCAARLLACLGAPLTATSANRSGAAPARTAQEVVAVFGHDVDLVLDDGPTPGNQPSTLVGYRHDRLVCLREGALPFVRILGDLEGTPDRSEDGRPQPKQHDHSGGEMSQLQWNREFALEQTAGDEELLEELLLLFKEASAGDLQKLRQAVGEKNVKAVVEAAHSLKGASASLGFETIRALAQEMEMDARQDSVACAAARLEEMAALLAEVEKL